VLELAERCQWLERWIASERRRLEHRLATEYQFDHHWPQRWLANKHLLDYRWLERRLERWWERQLERWRERQLVCWRERQLERWRECRLERWREC